MPPRIGAWNILDILETNREALTKDNEVATCLVLIPAKRKQEADASAKWIRAVKMQTTIRGFIKTLYNRF